MLFFEGQEGEEVAPVTDGSSADSRVAVKYACRLHDSDYLIAFTSDPYAS
jgi:hypothetical protein